MGLGCGWMNPPGWIGITTRHATMTYTRRLTHDVRDRGSRFFRGFFASRRTHLMRENENETRGVTTDDGHARRWSERGITQSDDFSRSIVFKVFPRVDIGKKRGLKKWYQSNRMGRLLLLWRRALGRGCETRVALELVLAVIRLL